jgi:pilus assembly protein Flp/PilA
MKRFAGAVTRFLRDEEGATGIEYAMLAGLIAVAFVVGAGLLGTSLNNFFYGVSLCVAEPSIATCAGPFNAAPPAAGGGG